MTTPQRDPNELQEILRGMRVRRISRREMLRYTGMGAGAAGLAAFLAACGVGGTGGTATSAGPSGTASASPSPLPAKAGEVSVANWPLYIDLEDGASATLEGFTQQAGIQINYKEDINDNDEFLGTDLRQQLSAGEPTDWDSITMTDWMIAKLVRLGWVQPLHQEALPNCTANLRPEFANPWFDPGQAYSYPWAAGITGIGYNRKLTGRDITSLNDLFDPAWGQASVGMFSEMRDTMNFALMSMGVIPPDQATEEQIQAAFEKLQQQKDTGIVRQYYGNDYTDQLAGGNLKLCMAWSGDVNALKVDNPDLEFVVPSEGGNRWTDNMCIPIMAAHATDAHEWMNFVYDPQVAAGITEFVWYESPVTGVQQIIQEHAQSDPELEPVAASPLVWPTPDVLANTFGYLDLSEDAEAEWHDVFDPLIQG